jgi:uncharacterized protein
MPQKINRHEFINSSLAEGGTKLESSGIIKSFMATGLIVPKREFGNTGVKISELCLGGSSLTGTDSQAFLDEVLKYGVDCWEYGSSTGKVYGEYFKKHHKVREKVFLTGKVNSTDTTVMEKQLDKLLNENETSFIDFLAFHVLENIAVLTDDVKKWVEKVKKEKYPIFWILYP